MAALEDFTAAATGTKNAAIGIGILAALAAVAYLAYKAYQGAAAVGHAAQQAGGYLFGTSQTSTIGTDLYGAINPTQPYFDEAQAIKTCNLDFQRTGQVRGSICQQLQAAGKLDAPAA